jgi:hypothetical protein
MINALIAVWYSGRTTVSPDLTKVYASVAVSHGTALGGAWITQTLGDIIGMG